MESYWNIVCKQEKVNIKSLLIKFSHTQPHTCIRSRSHIHILFSQTHIYTLVWSAMPCLYAVLFELPCSPFIMKTNSMSLGVLLIQFQLVFFSLSLSSFLDSDARIFKKNQAINHDSTFVRIFHTHTERESG